MKDLTELFSVEGQGVVVTGGASGIGLGYAEAMAANGAKVTLLDLDGQRIETEVARLAALGLAVRGAAGDVTDHAALDAAFDEAAAAHGRLDTVFANAGIDSGVGYLGAWVGETRPRVSEGALENYDDARWVRVIAICLNAVFATARAAARHMRPNKSGRIIVTTSAADICLIRACSANSARRSTCTGWAFHLICMAWRSTLPRARRPTLPASRS